MLRRANLAYGPAIMFGAYAATWAGLNFHASLLLLAGVTVGAAVLAGAYVERLCFAPHRKGAAAAAMVASFALWMQLEELAMLALPRHLYPFPPLYEGGPLALGPFILRDGSVGDASRPPLPSASRSGSSCIARASAWRCAP